MKIDTHVHIWSAQDYSKELTRYKPSYSFSEKELSNIFNKHKIEKAVLVQPSFLGNNNEILLNTLKKYPDTYRGVIVLNNFHSLNNLEKLLKSYDLLGVNGIRFNLIGQELPKLETFKNLFCILIKLDWHIEIHADEEKICTLLKNFKNSDLKIVLDHFARPEGQNYSKDFIAILKSNLNLHVKVSAPYRLKNINIDKYVETLLSTIGENSLLWGSDCPFTASENLWDYQKSIDFVNTNKLLCNMSSTLDENARNFFTWDK